MGRNRRLLYAPYFYLIRAPDVLLNGVTTMGRGLEARSARAHRMRSLAYPRLFSMDARRAPCVFVYCRPGKVNDSSMHVCARMRSRAHAQVQRESRCITNPLRLCHLQCALHATPSRRGEPPAPIAPRRICVCCPLLRTATSPSGHPHPSRRHGVYSPILEARCSRADFARSTPRAAAT